MYWAVLTIEATVAALVALIVEEHFATEDVEEMRGCTSLQPFLYSEPLFCLSRLYGEQQLARNLDSISGKSDRAGESYCFV